MPRSRSRSPPRQRKQYSEEGSRLYRGRDYSERRSDRRGRDDGRDRRRDYDRYANEGRGGRRRNGDRRSRSPERSPHFRLQNIGDGPSQNRRRSPGPSVSKSRSGSPSEDKTKPNFRPSGLLAAETNTVERVDGTSTFLKYNEPPEARRPSQGWRLYVFKGKEQVDLMHINRQSAYLIGRDRVICDIPVEHPSCSKQHAVIQYRHVPEKDEQGNVKATVKPFIIDLESTNGTIVNDETIPVSRYYELKLSDVIKFGLSEREYVLLHEDV